MPLSEHEQRLLEQMERALYAEDPKFATALEGSGMRTHTRRRTGLAITGFVLGLVLLMTGVMVPSIWVASVVGFVLMLTGAVVAVTGWRKAPSHSQDGGRSAGRGGPAPAPRRTRMMNRIEDRWRRRRDEQSGF